MNHVVLLVTDSKHSYLPIHLVVVLPCSLKFLACLATHTYVRAYNAHMHMQVPELILANLSATSTATTRHWLCMYLGTRIHLV